jgi:hypothetical protein
MHRRKNLVILCVITGLVYFGLIREIAFSSQSGQKKESQKPEVISLLGKELFATPAEGDELKEESEIVEMAQTSDLDLATLGYGIGCWHLYNSESEKAKTYFESIVQTPYWPAFGFIAAEAELYRMSLKQ